MVNGRPDGFLDATSAGSGLYMLKVVQHVLRHRARRQPSSTTADAVTRRQLLQQLQGQLNQDGPFFPLLEPGRVMVTTADIAAIDYNPTWSLDLASVTG